MATILIENKSHPLPKAQRAVYCDSFLCRLRGLMFRSRLAEDEGLLLVEGRDSRLDSAIHMFFVFMDLAVIWINANNQVVDIVLARAWHPMYVPRAPAKLILEILPSRLEEYQIGDKIELVR
jgi:uncharacterized membrane protein (UPF0127 family)